MNEILSAGKYFIGDPSLVLPSKIYIGIWGNQYDYTNGKYNIFGKDLCIHNTHYGDGTYNDTRNRKYYIESGLLGLVPIELIEDIELCKNIGYVYEFKKSINFLYDAGIFIIKSDKKYIKIDTQNSEEYNHSDDEHVFNDDGEPLSNTYCNASDDDVIEDENDDLFNLNNDEQEELKEENKEENNFQFQFFKKK
jgi:hypothetical protein